MAKRNTFFEDEKIEKKIVRHFDLYDAYCNRTYAHGLWRGTESR